MPEKKEKYVLQVSIGSLHIWEDYKEGTLEEMQESVKYVTRKYHRILRVVETNFKKEIKN